MQAGAALREALERAGSRRVLALIIGFTLLAVGSVLARQSLLAASLEQYVASGGDPGALPVPPTQFRPLPLALGIGYGQSLALFAAIAVIYEYATIVALRVFAGGASLRAAMRRRPFRAIVSGIAVGLVVKALVVAGLVAFLLPGLFLAAALLYAHARVAVEDETAGTALGEAWALTRGRRREVAPVLAYLAALYVTPRLLATFVPGAPGLLLGAVLVAAATVPAVAVVAGSYVRLRDTTHEGAKDEDEEDKDPYAQPLGPDDLPEPE